MARPDKVAVVEDVKERLTTSVATLLTDYRGLSVSEQHELRAALREANASYRVAKNTLTRRAVTEAGFDGLEELLVGPVGLVFCYEDPVAPAKALKAFAKDHPELTVKGGYLDGQVLDEQAAMQLAELASREELLSKLAGLMYGALANTARLLKAPIEQQARLVQALIDAGGYAGAGEGAAAEAPAAEEAAAVEEAPSAEAPSDEAVEEAPAAETPEEAVAEESSEEPPAAETTDED